MRTIVTVALQRQYSQTELIFWITLVLVDQKICVGSRAYFRHQIVMVEFSAV